MVLKMYEEVLILAGSGLASFSLILFSIYKFDRDIKRRLNMDEGGQELVYRRETSYVTRKRELEYMRDVLQDAIARIYKEFEEGRISGEEKDLLIAKFRVKLDEVERELREISVYAELEQLENEYNKLLTDYERRKRELEERINRIRQRVRVVEAKKTEEAEKKEVRRRPREEVSLSDLMSELSDMIKRLEEEE